jgi:hypothetical protein
MKILAIVWTSTLLSACAFAQQEQPIQIRTDWNNTILVSKSTATYQVVANPMLERGAKLHDGSFQAIAAAHADYVRFVPWLPYPRLAVAELEAPTKDKTYWDFSLLDPFIEDLMNAIKGHSVIINFSTMPAWLWKTDKPVTYPNDPNEVYWDYTQGTEIKDPTYQQAAAYYARLLSWYERGGFTDELGHFHKSNHHYKFAYWEVLNEIDSEHRWTPVEYAKFFDTVTAAMRTVDPDLKFIACASAFPANSGEMYRYFLDPKNHLPGTAIDFLSYHFYASPPTDEPFEAMQYTFFDQADGFLRIAKYVEQLKHELSPETRTDMDELGAILPGDDASNHGGQAQREPAHYWNLASALYAYLYIGAAKLGVDVVGESQLVGYPTQYPSVSMMDYVTGQPNARFWTMKLLKDNVGPGNQIVETSTQGSSVTAQGFRTGNRKKLLLVNKRDRDVKIQLPEGAESITFVAPSTGDGEPKTALLEMRTVSLEPFEVAIVDIR